VPPTDAPGDIDGLPSAGPSRVEPLPVPGEKSSASPGGAATTRRFLLLCLAAGLSAGLLSWVVEEVALRYFGPSYVLTKEQERSAAASGAELARQRLVTMTRTAMTSYGLLGGLLGLGLGVVGGRVGGSRARGTTAGLLGLLLGGVACILPSWLLVPRYYVELAAADDLTFPLKVHLGMWVNAGIVGGLALAIGLGSWSRVVPAVLGGALGAAFGTAFYEFSGAFAFPTAETNLPLSITLGSRLTAHLAVAVFSALGAGVVVQFVAVGRERPGKVT
jgi:hypothetical protein